MKKLTLTISDNNNEATRTISKVFTCEEIGRVHPATLLQEEYEALLKRFNEGPSEYVRGRKGEG